MTDTGRARGTGAEWKKGCKHDGAFASHVSVKRFDRGGYFQYRANIGISCGECGEPFRWLGVPVGLSVFEPMCSIDELELRAPLKPNGSGVIGEREQNASAGQDQFNGSSRLESNDD